MRKIFTLFILCGIFNAAEAQVHFTKGCLVQETILEENKLAKYELDLQTSEAEPMLWLNFISGNTKQLNIGTYTLSKAAINQMPARSFYGSLLNTPKGTTIEEGTIHVKAILSNNAISFNYTFTLSNGQSLKGTFKGRLSKTYLRS